MYPVRRLDWLKDRRIETLRTDKSEGIMISKKLAFFVIAGLSISGYIWYQSGSDEREAKAIQAEQAAEAVRRQQDLIARQEENEKLNALTDDELVEIGERCVREIKKEAKAETLILWDLIDISPMTMRDIEVNAYSGLRMTAVSDGVSVSRIISEQIERINLDRARGITSDQMVFHANELRSGLSGNVELVVEYKCRYRNFDRLSVREGQSVVLG